MATQRSTLTRTQRLTQRWSRSRGMAQVRCSAGKIVFFFALLSVLLTQMGQAAPPAHAAPAGSPGCPTWYSDGTAQCKGKVTQSGPPSLQPPSSSGSGLDYWYVCISFQQFLAWFYNPNPGGWQEEWDYPWYDWSGNWFAVMIAYPDTVVKGLVWPDVSSSYANMTQPVPVPPNYPTDTWVDEVPQGGWPPCPPPQPPCTTCFPTPTLNNLYYNFWSYAPVAVVSGKSQCPDGTFGECPPSVGHPVQLWVDTFTSNAGPTYACEDLGNVGVYGILYPDLVLCLRWIQQAGSLSWNFDDETVNPTTGQGTPTPLQTGGQDAAHPVTHTFQYSSAYDPLRGCVRPCSGDLTGPNGSPAFQVSVSSEWWLQEGIGVNGFGSVRWTTINLQDFGSSTPFFTTTTTVPVPVFSYGSVTTP